MYKPTILIDFDETITEKRGFDSPPSREAVCAIKKLSQNFKIVIYSCRANSEICRSCEYVLLENYLNLHEIPYDEICTEKPIFYALIDDRSMNPKILGWDAIIELLTKNI